MHSTGLLLDIVNCIWHIGSIDIEDVEKLLDEMGSLKENESKNETNDNAHVNDNLVNWGSCNSTESDMYNMKEKHEIKRKVSSISEVIFKLRVNENRLCIIFLFFK